MSALVSKKLIKTELSTPKKPNSEVENVLQSIPDIILGKKSSIVRARPGTGKTTLLKKIASTYKKNNFLYLTFSKEGYLNAKKIMPSNCECMNIHSFALSYIKNKGNIYQGYKTTEIAKITHSVMTIASDIRQLLEEYLRSEYLNLDEYIEKTNVHYKNKVIKKTGELLEKMVKREIPITHQYYLKEFAVMLSIGLKIDKYDCILIDEYQDTNAITAKIYKLLDAGKIYVGDEDQSIFGFMGASDSSVGIKFDYEFSLSYSYRSNEAVIAYANRVLVDMKGREYKIRSSGADIKSTNTKAIICRTNALIIEYISLYEKFSLVKDPDDIFRLPIAVAKWFDGLEVEKKYWYIRKSKTERDLRSHARKTGDVSLLAAIAVAKKYGYRKLFSFYEKACNMYGEEHRVTLLSGHAAKGLEFDIVRISPDFQSLYDKARMCRSGAITRQELIEEVNLYYVAITRARLNIIDASDNQGLTRSEMHYIRKTIAY